MYFTHSLTSGELSLEGMYVEREKAIMEVLAWVQSQRDCQEVIEHMAIDVPIEQDVDLKQQRYFENKELLLRWLDEQDVTAEDWQKWFKALPDIAPKGVVKKRTPLKSVRAT